MNIQELKKEVREELKDFARTFASEEDSGDWWGHDTDLGNCKEEFDLATSNITSKVALAVLQMVEAEVNSLEAPTCEKKHGSRTCGKRVKNLTLDEVVSRLASLKQTV